MSGEEGDLRLQLRQDIFFFENAKACESGSAAELVAAIAVAVVEGLAEERLEDRFRSEGGCERHVTAGETLGQREEIGHRPLLLEGEHPAGASEAGHHLVRDEEHAVAIAPAADRGEKTARPRPHAGGALDEGLDHDRGDVFRLRQRSNSASDATCAAGK